MDGLWDKVLTRFATRLKLRVCKAFTWKLLTFVQFMDMISWTAGSNWRQLRYSEHKVKALRQHVAGQQPVRNRRQSSGPLSKQISKYSDAALISLLFNRVERFFLVLRMDFPLEDLNGMAGPRLTWPKSCVGSWAHFTLTSDAWCRRYCCKWRAAEPSLWAVGDLKRRSSGLRARSQHWSCPRSLAAIKKALLLCQLRWKGI